MKKLTVILLVLSLCLSLVPSLAEGILGQPFPDLSAHLRG